MTWAVLCLYSYVVFLHLMRLPAAIYVASILSSSVLSLTTPLLLPRIMTVGSNEGVHVSLPYMLIASTLSDIEIFNNLSASHFAL